MPATTERSARPPSRGTRRRRMAWFVGIWAASLGLVAALSYGLRALMSLAG